MVEFTPTKFYNEFSAEIKPVFTIWPGETIHTQTIDSGGVDEDGVTKALYGNSQTGPFYVGGAERGDVLAVHLKRLRLNRDYAGSLDAIAERVKDSQLAVEARDLGKRVRWKLDLKDGIATPDLPTEHLANFSVPLKPMLGCVAVAPDFGFARLPKSPRLSTCLPSRSPCRCPHLPHRNRRNSWLVVRNAEPVVLPTAVRYGRWCH
jgi:amidase